jgi:hypothetical protein
VVELLPTVISATPVGAEAGGVTEKVICVGVTDRPLGVRLPPLVFIATGTAGQDGGAVWVDEPKFFPVMVTA